MNIELESRVREAETSGGIRAPSRTESAGNSNKRNFWESDEEEYFDEWDEEKGRKGKKKLKGKNEPNDDLFYDPNMDDEDQAYVENIRKDYSKGRLNQTAKPVPNSDAVLNCPACFIVLSLDCQRHETYDNQYRAMFVMNCTVDKTQTLKYPEPKNRRKKGKKKIENNSAIDPQDLFNPVKCDRCST